MPRIAKHWFRFYSEALDSLKVQELTDREFRLWVRLLMVANTNQPRGQLPPLRHVAFALRTREVQLMPLISALVARGFVDRNSDEYAMHDWHEWQADRDVPPSQRSGDTEQALAVNHANVTGSARLRHAKDAPTSRVDHARVDQSGVEGKSGVEQNRVDHPPKPPQGGARVRGNRGATAIKDPGIKAALEKRRNGIVGAQSP